MGFALYSFLCRTLHALFYCAAAERAFARPLQPVRRGALLGTLRGRSPSPIAPHDFRHTARATTPHNLTAIALGKRALCRTTLAPMLYGMRPDAVQHGNETTSCNPEV
ncbi:MAG: hypothetical protein IJV22_01545 [Bacteroidales bacterium]|nr:hypothetical protein [Bacteroidales bacterium]